MRFAVTKDHRSFFQKNQVIELEGLCSSELLQSLTAAIDSTLAKRLHIKSRELDKQLPKTHFTSGRDLWRSNDLIKRFVTQPSFAEIAAELTGKRLLRLGYDQFFPGTSQDLLQSEQSLEQVSCIQGVQCGLMFCLKGIKSDEASIKTVFPLQEGNAILFSSSAPIPWNQLCQHPQNSYFMIVYAHHNSVYVYNEHDPLGNELKQWGYGISDKLTDKSNPIVHR